MNGLSGLKMAHKLTLGFTIVIALGFAVFLNTQHAMQSYIHSDNTISARAHDCVVISQNASLASKSMAQEVMAYDYTGDKRHWDAKYEADDTAAKCFADLKSSIQLLPDNSSLSSSLEQVLAQDGNICNPLEDQSMKLARAGKAAEAKQIYETEYVPARSKLESEIKELITALEGYTVAADTAQLKAAQLAIVFGWVLQVVTVLLGALAGWLITRYITQNLAHVSSRLTSISDHEIAGLSHAVEALERGDLTISMNSGTEPIAFVSKDEFGRMTETFNQMLAKVHSTTASFRTSQSSLCAMVREMQQSSAQVSNAAQTLSGTSRQISTATQDIESTVNEIAHSSEQSARTAGEVAHGSASQAMSIATGAEQVKELVVAIQSVTRDTESATQSASQADETAAAGVQAVKKTVAGMKRIEGAVSESSLVIESLGRTASKIGGIVQTIDEIASQTNLLALNAAIEAARAGESGRGFAVVADEVRKLAERCTGATQDIGSLIAEIQQQTEKAVSAMDSGTREVKVGMSLAGEAGASLERIQSVVSDLSARVLSIGAAAEEMSASAHDVSGTITEVAAIVDVSSASAMEMSATAQEVSVSIQSVARTTAQQGAVVESLVDSAGELAAISLSLDTLVSRFQIEADVDESTASLPRIALRKAA